jgi:cytoskeletal protein CcmA (bactofilin family)
VAWVGKSVIFKGDLTSSEDMTIDGRVEGSIQLRDHALTIGPDADIRANIVARTVTVHGSVTGKIDARDKVDLRETGSVLGDINSPRLAIADGAMLRGRVDTEAGDGDRKEKKAPVTAH